MSEQSVRTETVVPNGEGEALLAAVHLVISVKLLWPRDKSRIHHVERPKTMQNDGGSGARGGE